jgi:hypothetical protein
MRYDRAEMSFALRLAAAPALAGFFLATTTAASLPLPSGFPTGSPSDAESVATGANYAGACRLPHPRYRHDLRHWRYGDERDFFCFRMGDY